MRLLVFWTIYGNFEYVVPFKGREMKLNQVLSPILYGVTLLLSVKVKDQLPKDYSTGLEVVTVGGLREDFLCRRGVSNRVTDPF